MEEGSEFLSSLLIKLTRFSGKKRFGGQLYSKLSFGEVYCRIYGRKFSFTATCDGAVKGDF